MFEIYRKEIDWGGRPLILETGKVARQADGAVMATYGETTVLCTVVSEKQPREDLDFFPLGVHYQERTFAAGKIPGGFFKREGKPSEKETLTSRLIDRPIRPLFAEGFKNDTQVVATVLSHDIENDPDVVAMVGASAALVLSGIPFLGPIGAVRVGKIGDGYVLNPTQTDMERSELDLVVAGTREGVLMVESEAYELPESQMLEAVTWGHQQMQPVIDAIVEMAEACAHEPWPVPEPSYDVEALKARVREAIGQDLREVYAITDKQRRSEALSQLKQRAVDTLTAEGYEPGQVKPAFKALEKEIVRGQILTDGKRIDGRGAADIRPIASEVGVLPRAHGSALFTRGETQAFVVATLGTTSDEQFVDALEGEYRERFMLHYNFPPYCTGETGRIGFTSRREIGHGKLAWRAIHPLLPSKDDFPYTLRVVSEITESNGSSSMATVCGTSLSLMDAGVPLPRPIGGIAMGLVKEGDDYAVVSDILGDEDALGDMDFKVAGTDQGVTSLQMDIKITSITKEIMEKALGQAREGRLHILKEMTKAIADPRDDVASHAPRMTVISIPKEKIRDVIGPGGKIVREIVEASGAKIDIEDDGTVRIAAVEQTAANDAVRRIREIVAEPEVGEIYDGRVVKVVDFGAFVNFLGSRDGLVHISELNDDRPRRTTDVVDVGDTVKVKCTGFDDRGRVKLSMRLVDQESGADLEGKKAS